MINGRNADRNAVTSVAYKRLIYHLRRRITGGLVLAIQYCWPCDIKAERFAMLQNAGAGTFEKQ